MLHEDDTVDGYTVPSLPLINVNGKIQKNALPWNVGVA
jgi:hypothetical protein